MAAIRRVRGVFATAAAVGIMAVAPAPAWSTGAAGATGHVAAAVNETERWYRCSLGDAPCGHARETESTLEDGARRTSAELELRFLRDETETTTRIVTELVTRPDGRPRSMRLIQELGGEPVVTDWIFRAADVLERRRQGARVVESVLPFPEGEWHLPDAAWRIARREATSTMPIRVRVLDPLRGLDPAETTFKRLGDCDFTGPGGTQAATRWLVVDAEGTETREVHSISGDLLLSEVDMGAGLGVLKVEIATRNIATRAVDEPIELMEAGLVRPVFVGRSRRLDRGGTAIYRVRTRNDAPISLPSSGAQSVRMEPSGTSALVRVDPERSSEVEASVDRTRYLEPTALLDSDDPAVVAFARRHDRPGRSDLERARSVRKAVHRHIARKDLGTAFATAGETVRSRSGDCTEHAVLLAAALRTVGIPSRIVSGLVWTPRPSEESGAFLWHMWTQALVGDRWFDLDATLPGGRAFHPGHLTISTSDGGRSDLERNARAMLKLFGGVEIEVEPTEFEFPSEPGE